jgi:Fe-S cluster assembly iron-binding protein IscA
VLALTDSAVSAIRDLLADKDVPSEGGLRISTAPPADGDGEPTFELAVVIGPEANDAVVEREGVFVYVEPEAVPTFEGRVLDAHLDESGVSFTFIPAV